jgi:MEKHLA domain-containing protein
LIDLRNDLSFFSLLEDSYYRFIGQRLTPEGMTTEQAARWLYSDAPFAILAHNTGPDPTFIYGNKSAQLRFGYEWEELTALPSRLSAEMPNREERQEFLERVRRDGFSTGYNGVRIMKSGKRFRIEEATLWQLVDSNGAYRGQAAMIPKTTDLP